TDRRAGKRTLAVRLGRSRTRVLFAVIVYLAYLLTPVTWAFGPLKPWLLLPWLTLPVAARVVRIVRNHTDGASLNAALAQTGLLQLIFCTLLAAGVLLSRRGSRSGWPGWACACLLSPPPGPLRVGRGVSSSLWRRSG